MYDFSSVYSRKEDGSSKWLRMYSEKPELNKFIVPMSVADMDFPLCPEIIDGICDYVKNHILGYTFPTEEYRESVKQFLKKYHNYDIDINWIVTTPGIVPALSTSVRALTEENEGVIVFTPVYPQFKNVVEKQNRKLEICPLINKDNYYYIDFDRFEEIASDENNKLLILCSPHNPSGRIWDREELERVMDVANKHDLYVVSDEIHADIAINEKTHTVFGKINGSKEKSIICTSGSKTFNIAGLKCSNIIIPNEMIRNKFTQENEKISVLGTNVIGMIATKVAYEKGLDWLEEMKKTVKENQGILKEFFLSYGDKFNVFNVDASFLAWVDYSNTGISDDDLKKILVASDFFINDGVDFVSNGENFIRINVGLPKEELIKNLKRLAENLPF